MNRSPPTEDVFQAMKLFRDLMLFSRDYSVCVPGYEADDVIAGLVAHYSPRPIRIYSNDFDLMALTDGRPNVICGAEPKEGLPPSLIHLFKAWVGDPVRQYQGRARLRRQDLGSFAQALAAGDLQRCREARER